MWADGSFYEGDFVDGLFHGIGTYYFKESEKTYTGGFVEGRIEGDGEARWADGREYQGHFKNGKEDGEGTMRFANGNIYIGSFKEGRMHGFAIFINSEESTKRHGEWREGKRIAWLSSSEGIQTSGSPIKALSHLSRRS
jgi:hypothetical protein